MVWDVELEHEIDVNNPLKSIKEIYDDIKRRLAIKLIKELNIKEFITLVGRRDYPKRVHLGSLNGMILVVFSKESEPLDKLLEHFEVKYGASKYNIGENEIYKIVKRYGIDPKATSIRTSFYIEQRIPYEYYKLSVWYDIGEGRLRIYVQPHINRYLYDSLEDTLRRFGVNETKIREIIANIENGIREDINIYLYGDIPVEEYVDIYTNIYLENVKRGFVVESLNRWKISEDYSGKILIRYNPKDYYIIGIEIYPPTEEKIKQLLIDMKNIGMDTKIKRAVAFYY